MRIATSLLPLTKTAARSKKLSGLPWSGADFCCFIFPGLESGIAVLHFVIIQSLKLQGTSGKSGMHRKRKHPNKREQQANPFIHQSQFGHAAHPAGTESQTTSRNNAACLCSILLVAFYKGLLCLASRWEDLRLWEGVRTSQAAAARPAPSPRAPCCVQTCRQRHSRHRRLHRGCGKITHIITTQQGESSPCKNATWCVPKLHAERKEEHRKLGSSKTDWADRGKHIKRHVPSVRATKLSAAIQTCLSRWPSTHTQPWWHLNHQIQLPSLPQRHHKKLRKCGGVLKRTSKKLCGDWNAWIFGKD